MSLILSKLKVVTLVMASAMGMVCDTLGINKINMDNKMILIEEHHGTNANFLLNTILSHALKKMDAICLILCHNTFGHFHNIGIRFGYNLLASKEKGQLTIVEPMKIITSNITDMCSDPIDKEKTIISNATSTEHVDIMHRLLIYIKQEYDKAEKFSKSVVVIIDDINQFLDLGLDIRDIMYFMRYLRSFMMIHPYSQLCVLTHVYQRDPQVSNADMVADALKHMAHLCVTTEPFKTGHTSDTSGKLIIYWRIDIVKTKYHWMEKTIHLFKLLDWKIKIYAPGALSVLS